MGIMATPANSKKNNCGLYSKLRITCTILLLVSMAVFTGCSRTYVAAKPDFGIPATQKPVIGVLAKDFKFNSHTNIGYDMFAARSFVDSIIRNGGKAKVVDAGTYEKLDLAATKFLDMKIGGMFKRKIDADAAFGPLGGEFKQAGIDCLLVLTGDASTPSLAQVASLMLADAMIYKAINGTLSGISFVHVTPMTRFITLIVNGEGRPQYNGTSVFTTMTKRDLGSPGDRAKMFNELYEEITGDVSL